MIIKKILTTLIFLLMLSMPAQAIQVASIIYNVTSTSATIDFVLEVSDNSKIILEYGVDQTYGKTVELVVSEKKVNGLFMTVPLTINKLKPNTEYHYRVTIHDGSGNFNTLSLDATFNTGSQNIL
jgi:phosphodiesterase/alkaline phosphatase D-like protein